MNTQTIRRTTGLMEKGLSPNWSVAREKPVGPLLAAVERWHDFFRSSTVGREGGGGGEQESIRGVGTGEERESERVFTTHTLHVRPF